jgi:hypothetical protein
MRNIRILRTTPAEAIDQSILGKTDKRAADGSFGDNNLPPMWGKVLETSGPCHVDVELVNGLKLKYVPVRSDRWVTPIDSTHTTGHKDIPPVGAKVLIIFPDGIIENPLVLCSGFDPLAKSQAPLLKDGDKTKDMDIDEYGWSFTEEKGTGKKTWKSPDNSNYNQITVVVDVEGKSIVLTQQFTTTDKTVVTMTDSKVEVEDKNHNKLTLDSQGVKITDKSGNTIAMTSGGINFNNGNFEVLP